MKEFYLSGNFCESTCKWIKKMMQGKTFHGFSVCWSNFAGNCGFVIHYESDYNAKEAEGAFHFSLINEAAEQMKRATLFKEYIESKRKGREKILLFREKYDIKAYFDDALLLSEKCGLNLGKWQPYGDDFSWVGKEHESELLYELNARGMEYKIIDWED